MAVLDVETLLAHEAFVRRITRALVRDEHDADDVVQDTFVAALERPPRAGVDLRGWLAAVARNLARRKHRSREREARRHARLRPPEPMPPDQAAQRREVEHAVMAAVLVLEDPYRRAVLDRYHDGLSLRECAARAGVPVTTVKTRLRRALARLRARLDRRHGGRAAWTTVLPVAGSAPARTAVGVLLMGKLAKISVVAAALATGLLVWWNVAPEQASRAEAGRPEAGPVATGASPRQTGRAGPVAAGRSAREPGRTRGVAPGNETAPLPPVEPKAREEPGPRRIVGRVVRQNGEDDPRVAAGVSPSGHFAFYDIAEGAYDLTYKNKLFGSEVMSVAGGKAVQSWQDDVTLQLLAGDTIEGVVVDESNQPKKGVWVRATAGSVLTGAYTDEEGRFVVEGLDASASYTLTPWEEGYVPQRHAGVRAGTRGVHLRLDPGETSTGRLLDADDRPVANAHLRVGAGGSSLPVRPETDAEGRFTVPGLPAGATVHVHLLEDSWSFRAGQRDVVLRLPR